MRRDDPVAEQECSFGQQWPDQAIFPSNQDAESDDNDDREINQVHEATPLSPMEPRNSTPAVSQPFVKRDSRPKGREVSSITDSPGRVGHRSNRDPRQASADTHPSRAGGNEVSE